MAQKDNEDELLIVFKGRLTLQLIMGNVILNAGEMYVVSKGIEHCPIVKIGYSLYTVVDIELRGCPWINRSGDYVCFIMVQPSSTAHTGETQGGFSV